MNVKVTHELLLYLYINCLSNVLLLFITLSKERNKNFPNESCCLLEVFIIIVQNKLNINNVYFQ